MSRNSPQYVALAIAVVTFLWQAACFAKQWMIGAVVVLRHAGSVAGHPLWTLAPVVCFYSLAVLLGLVTITIFYAKKFDNGLSERERNNVVAKVSIGFTNSFATLYWGVVVTLMFCCIAASASEPYWTN